MRHEAFGAGLTEQIQQRLTALRRSVSEHTDREVRVVCVTKAHGPEVVQAALDAGLVDIGENYAQELVAKAAVLADGEDGSQLPKWHFIGRLQSNKVRALAGVLHLWQSVDRPSVAAEIGRRAPGASVLVQVDLAGIEGRGGCPVDSVPEMVQRCRDAGLAVEGLMGVGLPGPPEKSRDGFRMLHSLAGDLGLAHRSMGMSGDYRVAVEEGSTMIRVGTALVGPRSRPDTDAP